MEATSSGGRVQVGKVIGEAFETYKQNFGALIGGGIIVLGIAGIIYGLLAREGGILALIGAIINLVAQVLYTGYVVKLVQDVRGGRRDQSVGDLFSAAAPFILTLILNGILYGIAVFIGFALLIIPGLILITIWAVVAPAIVVEGEGVIGAFGRSRELVRGDGWNVFGTIVVAFLIVIAVYIVLTLIGAALGAAGAVIFGAIAAILAVPVAALVSAILFFDLGGGQAAPPVAEPAPAAPAV